MPSSAATVSGVVCERSRFADSCVFASSLLACGWPPIPTPATGWCTAIRTPLRTSFPRPPEALFFYFVAFLIVFVISGSRTMFVLFGLRRGRKLLPTKRVHCPSENTSAMVFAIFNPRTN